MPFNDSEIPDILIQEGCITEDECRYIREKTDRKDQVRKLLLLIRGRNFDIIKKYLDAADKYCPTAVQKVWTHYNSLMNKCMGPWVCPMCELKDCVDVKYVVDTLYGERAISTGLYATICNSPNLVGQQNYLWDSVLKACTGANLKFLTDALKAKKHYNHIADSLSIYHRRTSNDVYCQCSTIGTPPALPQSDTDEIESSTTCSPKSTPFTTDIEDSTDTTHSNLQIVSAEIEAKIGDWDNIIVIDAYNDGETSYKNCFVAVLIFS